MRELKKYLETGEIVAVQGLKGEVRVYPWSSSPDYLCSFRTLYLDAAGEKALPVEHMRVKNPLVVAKFAGVDSPEDAQKLRGKILYIDRNDAPGGGIFWQDLIGCTVRDADTGAKYGEVTEIQNLGSADIYTVRTAAGEVLMPATPGCIVECDAAEGLLTVRPVKGLFDDED